MNGLKVLSSRPLLGVLISLPSSGLSPAVSLEFVLVPFSGFLYLYNEAFSQCSVRLFVLVPFSGFLYLYTHEHCYTRRACVLVPFSGFLYLYRKASSLGRVGCYVLVPFSGFLYLYETEINYLLTTHNFSSPSRGSYISTNLIIEKGLFGDSRPLLGVLISLPVSTSIMWM